MIAIDNYDYNNIKTTSYKLQVKHESPELAAYIANTVVEHYFNFLQSESRKRFEEFHVLHC